jgi:hypothetical protein
LYRSFCSRATPGPFTCIRLSIFHIGGIRHSLGSQLARKSSVLTVLANLIEISFWPDAFSVFASASSEMFISLETA